MPGDKRFLLRLDPELFETVRRWADEDLRSINGQIEYLLSEQARRAGRLPRRRSLPPHGDQLDTDASGEPLTDRDEDLREARR